ncbi:hypothetical protein [Hymenobacter terrenus]|uniref:hypothetical protein n=1 Tax=Hymenobacter terrenus TaxID=1629124 RepID=UPI0006196638|nr:hypothetical protein [Hymenobacter terrenus]
MALDIWLISETGQGVKYVPIHMATHDAMWDWNQVNQQHFPLLSRMNCYYGAEGDAEFLPVEIGDLLAELRGFMDRPDLPSASELEMERFIHLAQEAQRGRLGLEVRAD